jgi:hypothetical protein
MLPVNLVYSVCYIQESAVQKLVAGLINCKEQEDYFPVLVIKAGLSFSLKRKEIGL